MSSQTSAFVHRNDHNQPSSPLTDRVRSVLIANCRFEGEEPQINQHPSSPSDSTPIIALADASKSYGAVRAAQGVDIALRPGEVRALAGENGAGKSTIVRLLAGVQRADEGRVLVDGEAIDFGGPADARDKGVAVIYQEPTLFPDLSVTENIFMGRMPMGGGHRIDRAGMHRETNALFQRLGVHIDPRRPALGLSIADQQIIEIAKAISLDASVLIMDEPTAALSGVEVDRLFAIARSLRDEGRALLFISHRFD
jgi:rhamnose transport system ATP-binding protein